MTDDAGERIEREEHEIVSAVYKNGEFSTLDKDGNFETIDEATLGLGDRMVLWRVNCFPRLFEKNRRMVRLLRLVYHEGEAISQGTLGLVLKMLQGAEDAQP